MNTSTTHYRTLFAFSLAALSGWACGDSGPSAADLNRMNTGGGTQASGGSSGTGGDSSSGGSTGTGGDSSSGGSTGTGGSQASGGSTGTGGDQSGSGGSTGTGGDQGSDASAGSGGAGDDGGTGGASATGGSAGKGGSGGGTDAGAAGPYAPRTGPFKMLVITRTKGYRHASIADGTVMLTAIAKEQGFQVTFAGSSTTDALSDAEVAAQITADNLKQYEIIFHLQTTGAVYSPDQHTIIEDWMTKSNGAFAGVHAATDTEQTWPFYQEMTGQYYGGHAAAGTNGIVTFEPAEANNPIVKGLPSPWMRQEEWYRFPSWTVWSAKPGFKILATRSNVASTPPEPDPVASTYLREWSNFRSFYSALGHAGVVYQDADFKKMMTRGILWAVRREALIK